MATKLVCGSLPTGNGAGHSNEVTLRRVWLVLRRVTIGGYTAVESNQPLRPTQPPILSRMRKVPAKWKCSLTGKVTVGLIMHLPYIRDSERALVIALQVL